MSLKISEADITGIFSSEADIFNKQAGILIPKSGIYDL